MRQRVARNPVPLPDGREVSVTISVGGAFAPQWVRSTPELWMADGVIVGLGLNVDTAREDLPLDTATSLRAAGAPGVDRAALLSAFLTHLAALLRDDTGPGGSTQAAYVAACSTVGRAVEVHLPGGAVVHGTGTGVDAAGRLTVRDETGTQSVSAGDVVHVRSR